MTMPLNRFDLNLLRVFDAVMEERSVLRASQRICVSPTAVSHALARLRELLDDELFVRTTAGMQPTARSVTMAPLIRQAWKSLEAAIDVNRRSNLALTQFWCTSFIRHRSVWPEAGQFCRARTFAV
jgi:DNA-binding transcriptional LysR family regulator